MNIKTILVPTDFSDMSTKGLKAAQHLAKLWDAKVTPFHAYGPGQSDKHNEDGPIDQELVSQLNDEAKKYIDSSLLSAGVISAEKPLDGINHAAADYDLVVMSTHGRTGFSRLLMGSVAEKVIRTCSRPVVVVENDAPLAKMDSFLVTTDFSDNSLKVLPYVKEFAKKSGAKVELKYIETYEQYQKMSELQGIQSKKNRRLQQVVDEHLSDISDQVEPEVVLSNRSIHEEITRLSTQKPYSMLMMATLGWTGLDYLRLGSTASNVVRHVECPVFTINPKTQE